MSDSILVSGASGNLGRGVVEALLERGHGGRLVAVSRKPENLADLSARGVEVRRADFDDEGSLATAFQGVSRALVISTDALDKPGHRGAQHARAFQALARAGAQHIVYTSIVNPQGSRILISKDHADSEASLAAVGVPHTVLRDNLYSQLLLDSLKRALGSGKLVDARDAGKVAYVTREDVAAVAAAVLLEPPPGNQILDVTGPAALSSVEIAALASEISGRPLVHQPVPLAALVDGMVQHGLPRPLAEVFASFDSGIAAGELAVVSDSVARFTGKQPQSLGDFLRQTKSSWAS